MPGATDHVALADQAVTTYQQDHQAGTGRSLADIVHEITQASAAHVPDDERTEFERGVLDAARALLAKERAPTKAEAALPALEALDVGAPDWQSKVGALDGYDAGRSRQALEIGSNVVGFVDGSSAHFRPDLRRWVPLEHPDTTRQGAAEPLQQ